MSTYSTCRRGGKTCDLSQSIEVMLAGDTHFTGRLRLQAALEPRKLAPLAIMGTWQRPTLNR